MIIVLLQGIMLRIVPCVAVQEVETLQDLLGRRCLQEEHSPKILYYYNTWGEQGNSGRRED